jgi:hypothetical protein
MLEQKSAEICCVTYVDLAETSNISTQSFFDHKTSYSKLSVCGWVMEQEIGGVLCLKICYLHDEDGNENSSGIVIPISCIISCDKLVNSGEKLFEPELAN